MIRDTQREAYQSLDGASARRCVLTAITLQGDQGATLFELVDLLHWPINSISGRVTELASAGFIEDTQDRRVNPATDRKAIVWRRTQE